MKKILLFAVLILVLLLVWWLYPGRSRNEQVLSEVTQNSSPEALSNAVPQPEVSNRTPIIQTVPAEGVPEQKETRSATEQIYDEWKTPINFFGKVVDENNAPVANADVRFSWTDLSATGTSQRAETSSGDGTFSLRSVTGKNLIVEVQKEGYYAYQPSGMAFNYAGENQNFVPNRNAPVVFRLRKKGVGESLIHFHKSFRVPKDGTPIQVDLLTGTLTSSSLAAIKVECWTNDSEKKSGRKFDWRCRLSLPGGGLQVHDEKFPFQAPEDGFVSQDDIEMPAMNDVEWAQDVRRNYFIQTPEGKFGRISFRMVAHGDHFCVIDSFLNPSGSRNLEPRDGQPPQAVQE